MIMKQETKKDRGITLIALTITIVILIILSSVGIYLSLENNGIFSKAQQAKSETIKQTATEKMNLKITNMQIEKYAKEQRMPTLQEFADELCEDNEIQYVELQSKKVGSLDKINVGNADSLFTKLKDYPYEFEINSSLQLASIDGVKVATNNGSQSSSGVNYSLEETKTNDTWMGKPIYTKTIYIPSLPNAKMEEYNHNIENVENIWVNSGKSFFVDQSNMSVTVPAGHISNIGASVILYVNSTIIRINTGNTDRRVWKAYITLEYTKTTDTVQ